MGYQKNKGRSKTHNFIMLRHDMMKSDAWKSLSCSARVVWTEIALRYNSYNNGDIPLSCREAAARCNIGKGTANKAFHELEDKGFIKTTQYAGFKNKKRFANRYALTHINNDINGDKPTDEWKKWKPEN